MLLPDILRALGCDVDTIGGRHLLVFAAASNSSDVRGVDVERFAEAMPPCVKTIGDLCLHLRIEGLRPRVDREALRRVLSG